MSEDEHPPPRPTPITAARAISAEGRERFERWAEVEAARREREAIERAAQKPEPPGLVEVRQLLEGNLFVARTLIEDGTIEHTPELRDLLARLEPLLALDDEAALADGLAQLMAYLRCHWPEPPNAMPRASE